MRTFTTVETLQPTKRRVITLGSPKQKSPAKSGVAQEKHVAFKNPQSGKSLAGTLTEVRLYAHAKLSACPSLPSPGSQRLLVVSCSVRVLHLFECSCTDRQVVENDVKCRTVGVRRQIGRPPDRAHRVRVLLPCSGNRADTRRSWSTCTILLCLPEGIRFDQIRSLTATRALRRH